MSNKNKRNNSAKNTKDRDYVLEIKRIFEKQNDLKTQEKVTPIDEVKKKWDMNEKILNLFANNIQQDQKLRSTYAIILIAILGIELITLITIFILGGCGILTYSDTTFNIFISGGIAEVFVLVRVIVKYLFNDNLTEALKIIIKNNNNKKTKYLENKKQQSNKGKEN